MDSFLPPDQADCCNSGCSPCILDVYQEQLRRCKTRNERPETNFTNCLSETAYAVFELLEKIQHTRDTYFFIFKYARSYREEASQNEETALRLRYRAGQHFLLRASYAGGAYTRAYTPIPFDDVNPLCFCVLVRIYDDGRMSRYLNRLKISSETLWRGPYCDFEVNYQYKHMLLVAQGTGIAPLYAIIKDILANEDCETVMKLFFCCRSCDDILLRSQLYECMSYWNFNYKVFLSAADNVIVKYNEEIHGRRLEKADIESYMIGKNDNGTQVLICGNKSFNKCISEYLNDFGEINVFAFL